MEKMNMMMERFMTAQKTIMESMNNKIEATNIGNKNRSIYRERSEINERATRNDSYKRQIPSECIRESLFTGKSGPHTQKKMQDEDSDDEMQIAMKAIELAKMMKSKRR